MGDVLKKFGRYFLLDQVAQGGMAEIYRARMASLDGAGRFIVIKRIQAGFGENNEFLQMFKSEIKVTMGFNHPNIVQLYDYGDEAGQPFIAMEFVDGRNLRQFITRFNELRQPFPVELAAYVIEQVASGLHYAHSFKDKITGQPLNIVHRDISPQNILISYEGTVKVIDFGIAKAATNVESTRAGVIKGKPSYLSPEQISGEALDGRSDIFSLGAVLWEVLTGKKLFAGDNDLAVLKLIESCHSHVKPPSTINPRVPKELDYIVLKALAKNRDKRFQTADEFQRALHKFLYNYMTEFNPSDLSYYAKDLFKNEIVEDRKKIQRLNDEVERLLRGTQIEIVTSAAPQGFAEHDENTTTTIDSARRSPSDGISVRPESTALQVERNPNLMPPVRQEPAALPRVEPAPPSRASQSVVTAARRAPVQQIQNQKNAEAGGMRKTLLIAGAAALAVVFFGPDVGIRIPVVSDLVEGVGSQAKLVLEGDEKNVTVMVNGKPVASSIPATLKNLPVETPFRLSVTGASGSFDQEVFLKKGEKKTITLALKDSGRTVAQQTKSTTMSAERVPAEMPVPGKSILLRLNITPGGGQPVITVGGKPVNPDFPVVLVALDSPLELVADRNGFRSLRREFVLESRQLGGMKEWAMDVQMEPVQFGFLTVHTTPSADATIVLDGRPWVKKTPIEQEKLPIGTYSIKLANEVLGMEKIVTVTIQEGKVANIDERLEIKD